MLQGLLGLPPEIVVIATMTTERFNLYRPVPTPGQPINVGLHPFLVKDSIPEDQDIAWAVHSIHLNFSGGLLGM